MLRITKSHFHPKGSAESKDIETHFILVSEETKPLCKMSQLYAGISELSGQIKEEESVRNFGPIVARNDKNPTIKRTKYAGVVSNSVITLAQKILSPLTRAVELEGIPKELIDFVKTMSTGFKELTFPDWFSDTDRKKRVKFNIVFKDTLNSSKFWRCVPFTKLNALLCSSDNIAVLINDIFQAVFSNYKSTITIIANKNEFDQVECGGEMQKQLI